MANAPEKIWVRAPNWVGDVVMATPALRALRKNHPQAEIVLEGSAHLEDLMRGLPSFDRFLPAPGRGLRTPLSHAQTLRAERFDWAVLLPDSVRTALPPFLARVPTRVGYARDLARRALLTSSLTPPRRAGRRVPISMIERYLRITRALDCADAGQQLELAVDEAAREVVARRLAALDVADGDGLLVVTPGASYGSSKLWPVEHFASACDEIADTWGLRVVLAPGPGEEQIASEIVALMRKPGLNLIEPVTRLGELAALLERSRLLLTNDTGPRHIAVALGRRVVVLMGPTDPRHTAHLLEGQQVLVEEVDCAPCHLKTCPTDHRCMTLLEPQRAVDAARELLSWTATIVPDYRDLVPALEEVRSAGRTVALANGCFDLLHVGHVRMLADARREADVLIVALNSDESVRASKPDRPLVPLAERMEIISALEGVEYVTSFGEPTAGPLLAALRPEVQIKGTDRTPESVPERDIILGYGGRIAICGDPKTHSSSELIERLRGAGPARGT